MQPGLHAILKMISTRPRNLRKRRGFNKMQRSLSDEVHRKHLVTRTVLRYGPAKIAAVIGAIIVLTLSSFAVRNYLQRQNATVLNKLSNTTIELMANPRHDPSQ